MSNIIEITNTNGSIISFDGRVIELFISQASDRFHVKQLKSIRVKERRSGKMEIQGVAFTSLVFVNIDPSQKAEVDNFISQVQSAMS